MEKESVCLKYFLDGFFYGAILGGIIGTVAYIYFSLYG